MFAVRVSHATEKVKGVVPGLTGGVAGASPRRETAVPRQAAAGFMVMCSAFAPSSPSGALLPVPGAPQPAGCVIA